MRPGRAVPDARRHREHGKQPARAGQDQLLLQPVQAGPKRVGIARFVGGFQVGAVGQRAVAAFGNDVGSGEIFRLLFLGHTRRHEDDPMGQP